jgi:hypothetical protein
VSIRSAGNSSRIIEFVGDGEGIAIRVVGMGAGFGGLVEVSSDDIVLAREGLSEYGSSLSGMILVGGVAATPPIRTMPSYSSFGSHSFRSLAQTYLTVSYGTEDDLPIVLCEDETPLAVFFREDCFVIKWYFCLCAFE